MYQSQVIVANNRNNRITKHRLKSLSPFLFPKPNTTSHLTTSPNMPRRLFIDLSTTLRHRPPHVRRYYQINKTHFLQRMSHPSLNNRSFSSSSSNKTGFIGWYLRKLETYPVITKGITSSLIYTAADFTSQMITLPSSASYDFKRTSRMAIYGLLFLGPSQHLWFNFLSKILPKRDLNTTLKKILMGQAVFGPISNTVFFSYNGALQGDSGPQIIVRLKRDLLPTLLGGAMFWPVCDFVTFRFIPVHLQPLMNSSCAYVWNIYVTYMANRTNLTGA